MSKRFDIVRLDKGEMTSQGFLKVPATFTRTGVFNYRDKDGGIRRELRHPDDVFDKASLASLQMAPLTFKHPEIFVNSSNIKDLSVGYVGDGIHVDGQFVTGMVLVTDEKAIAEASKGTVELSCGYTADTVDESGTYDGLDYDCRQTNIRYNHVAQVSAGRAGPLVRLHLDADDAVQVITREDAKMKITVEGKEFDVDPAVAAYIKSLEEDESEETEDSKSKVKDAEAKSKAAKAEAKKAKEDAAEVQKTLDVLQAKLDSAESKLSERKDENMTAEKINQHVKARMKIEKVAEKALGNEFKEDASDLDLIKSVVAKHFSSIKLDGRSEDYLKAAFDIVAEDINKTHKNREMLSNRFSAPRTDADFDVKTAREEQTKHDSERWKSSLAASKK